MTNRERVICAINHRETDRLPYSFSLVPELQEKIKSRINLHKESEGCCFAYCGGGFFTEIKKDFFKDEFGVVWNRTKDKDIGVVENCLIPDAEDYSFTFPPVKSEEIKKSIESCILSGEEEGKFSIFNFGFSMFERAWTLRGMENLLIDMLENPLFVHRLMANITEYNLKVLEVALAYDKLDGVCFGDDWGQQSGLIMGITHWREFIKPYVAEMYAAVKKAGKYVFQHSCGDIELIFDDLIGIGLDVYQTFQPEIYDIEKVKAKYGSKLTFWGGISTQRLLPFASPDDIKKKIYRVAGIMSKGGGYILAPTHTMSGDIPVESVAAMIEAFKQQKSDT